MFTMVRIKRLSAGSIFKLIAIGLACSLIPLSTIFGLLAAFGAQTVNWNGQPLTGLAGLAASPVIGLMLAGTGTVFLGSACALGLWLYSFVRPMRILVEDAQVGDAGQLSVHTGNGP